MMLSMTGYGTGSAERNETQAFVEIRTGNHRFLDIHTRLAKEYGFLEPAIQQAVRKVLKRGRVDLNVMIQAPPSAEMLINTGTAKNYMEAIAKIRDDLGIQDALELDTLLNLPGVLQGRDMTFTRRTRVDAELATDLVRDCVDQALGDVVAMRVQEGGRLLSDLQQHLNAMREKKAAIGSFIPEAAGEYRQKLEERLARLSSTVELDPQRLAQEVALLVEKSDITEEITRLDSHFSQFQEITDSAQEAGKKMDFLLQEMHREINTTLSKTGNLSVTRLGLSIKGDIEKLREQVQNVE